jgi:hypothetical protein
MNKQYKVNGQDLTIKEYNELYYQEKHSTLTKLGELYNELYGCYGTGSAEENSKSQKVNRNLYADFTNAYNQYHKNKGQNYPEIWRVELGHSKDDDETKTLESIAKSEKLIKEAQKVVNLGEQLKSQRDKTGNEYNEKPYVPPTESQEEQTQKATKLIEVKLSAINEITTALNQDPKINTEELSDKNQSWQSNIDHAILNEAEVNDIKERVLNDIKVKREAKLKENPSRDKKRPREDDDDKQDTPNKKSGGLAELISQAQASNKFEDLKSLLEKISSYEGEVEYKENQSTINSLKLKTAIINKIEYKNGVVNNLKTRLDKIKDKVGDKNETIVSKLEQLKSATNMDEIARIENEITNEVGQLEANVTLDKMIEELKTIWQEVIDNKGDRNKVRSKLDEIKKFEASTNSYKKTAYESKSEELKSLMSKIDNSLTTEENKGITPWKIIVPVGLVALVVVGIFVYYRNKKKINEDDKL